MIYFIIIIISLIFGNLLISNILIGTFFFIENLFIIYFSTIIIGIFSGWLSISVLKKFHLSSKQKIISNIITLSCVLILIFLSLFITSSINSKLINQSEKDPTMAESLPSLFANYSTISIIIISLLYVISFNIPTIKSFYKEGEKEKIKYLSFSILVWLMLFFIIKELTNILILSI